MFYKKTINYLLIRNDCIENKIENLKKEYKDKLDNAYKHIEQLEKRINNIADYIQGPYTQQINKTFAELTQQINKNFEELSAKIFKNKPLPCTKSTKKTSKKKGK